MPDAFTQAVRASYAAGWARSGSAPLPRMHAGYQMALAAASENRVHPGVLEVTLQFGHLDGTWALVFDRREKLIAAHTATVTDAWHDLLRGTLPVAVRTFRHAAGITESSKPSDALKTAALAAASALLRMLPFDRGWQALRQALRDAIAAGRAEGAVDAVAIAAARVDRVGLAWDIAFDDAYRALAHLDTLWADTDTWLGRMLDRATADLGRALARSAEVGASYEDILAGAIGAIDGDNPDAVAFIVDWALSTGLSQGALALYAREGATAIDVLTAGDVRVCPECDQDEANGPYTPATAPFLPEHPLCVIGSTRVAVPAGIMAGYEAHRLPFNAAESGVGGAGDRRAGAASAVTEPVSKNALAGIHAATDRYYVGDVVTIRTALGYELTATPNHPVATRRGWVALAELAVGDDVLSSAEPEWLALVGPHPDVDHVPPCIEDVAQAFAVTLGPMPTAAEDFHGDGSGSEVHVVRTDRLLVHDREPAATKPVGELDFRRRDVRVDTPFAAGGERDQSFGSELRATDGVMCGGREPAPLVGAGPGHALIHGGATAPRGDSSFEQMSTNDVPTDAECGSDGLLALAAGVAPYDLGTVHLEAILTRVRLRRPDLRPGLVESGRHDASADADCLGDGLDRFAGTVAVDQIIEIHRDTWSGHVYNLDTSAGFYISNGILTHNCRCTYAASFDLGSFADWFTAA